jgi:hypothetical protein
MLQCTSQTELKILDKSYQASGKLIMNHYLYNKSQEKQVYNLECQNWMLVAIRHWEVESKVVGWEIKKLNRFPRKQDSRKIKLTVRELSCYIKRHVLTKKLLQSRIFGEFRYGV